MVQANPSKSIPVGIFVSSSDSRSRTKRSTPPRKRVVSVARVQVGPRGASQLWLGIAIAGATACMVFLVGVMSIAVVYAARSRAEPVAQVTTEPDDSTVQAQIPPNADGSAPGPTPVSPEVVPAKVEPATLEPAPPAPTLADKSEQLSPASLQATPATVADVEAASEDSLAGIALPMATKAASPPAANQPPAIAPQEPATCVADLGTSIHFVADPPEAFKQAKKENKLVFMLHLSGNFEDKCFT